MTNELKKEIASWYPGITDAELNDMIDDLVNFFAIGVKTVYETETAEETSDSLENNAALH